MDLKQTCRLIQCLPVDEALYLYFKSQGVDLLPWQYFEELESILNPEYLWNWGRGMSKTFLMSHRLVFCSIRRMYYYHYAPSDDQLEQFTIYLNSNPYVVDITKKVVRTLGGIPAKKKLITNKQTRSGRVDMVAIDEEAACEPHQEDFLDNMDFLLSNSVVPNIFHASTPIIGTPFERNFKRLKEKNLVSCRTYLDTPNILPNGRYIVNPKLMEEKKNKYLSEGRFWKYETEVLAKFAQAGGSVFRNAIFHDSIDDFPLDVQRTGTDFHGEYGAVVIGSNVNGSDIYFPHEFRYDQPNGKFDYSFFNVKYRGLPNYVEGGGFNDGYARYCNQNYGCIVCENTNMARTLRLQNALKFRLHFCSQLTPNLVEDVRTAKWNPNGQTYLKDDDHPCHYLDACMLCIPGIIGTGIYGKQIIHAPNNIIEQDKYRAKMIQK